MKCYYIDDSMFYDTDFSKEVLHRFLNLCEHSANVIFISSSHYSLPLFDQFINDVKLHNIQIIKSPAIFDISGVRGNLSDIGLYIEGFPKMESYSGSCIEYDIKSNTCKRIYLDLFPQYHQDDMDMLLKNLKRMLEEEIKSLKDKMIRN